MTVRYRQLTNNPQITPPIISQIFDSCSKLVAIAAKWTTRIKLRWSLMLTNSSCLEILLKGSKILGVIGLKKQQPTTIGTSRTMSICICRNVSDRLPKVNEVDLVSDGNYILMTEADPCCIMYISMSNVMTTSNYAVDIFINWNDSHILCYKQYMYECWFYKNELQRSMRAYFSRSASFTLAITIHFVYCTGNWLGTCVIRSFAQTAKF